MFLLGLWLLALMGGLFSLFQKTAVLVCGKSPMATHFEIDEDFVADQNKKSKAWVDEDFDHLARKLNRQGVDIEALVARAQAFRVAVPSWGVRRRHREIR